MELPKYGDYRHGTAPLPEDFVPRLVVLAVALVFKCRGSRRPAVLLTACKLTKFAQDTELVCCFVLSDPLWQWVSHELFQRR